MVEATTVRVRDALRQALPGRGGYAALKVHTILAVGCGAPVPSHVSPAREHDSRHRQLDESWRGYGLLADLAYASLARLRACATHGVRYVRRLQEHWQPKVDHLARGQVTPAFFPGTDFDALLQDETLLLDGRAMDAEVQVGTGHKRVQVRRVGVHTPKGECVFLTNLPPRIGPRQVADRYRVRWEVERSIRRETSVNRLDAMDAEPPWTLRPLLQASLIASTLAAILAPPHHRHTRPQQSGAPRTEAPVHPRRLALPLGVACPSMAQACARRGAQATHGWNTMAEWLTRRGQDPNWRRRPSVLDQLRGWKRQPLVRPKPHRGDVSHGLVKVAA